MERKYNTVSENEVDDGNIITIATETFMANLPIFVCGTVMVFMIVQEMLPWLFT
jgi:hypothetical protein